MTPDDICRLITEGMKLHRIEARLDALENAVWPPPSDDELREAVLLCVEQKGLETVRQVYAPYGIQKAWEIPTNKRRELVEALTAARGT